MYMYIYMIIKLNLTLIYFVLPTELHLLEIIEIINLTIQSS